VFYTTGDLTKSGTDKTPPMTEKGKQALLDAVASGKGFVGSHCASDTFHTPGKAFETQDKKDPYIAMVGGEFIRHGAQQKAKMTVVNPKFPGMSAANEGFEMHEEWYSLKNFAPDLHVLLVNETTGMQGKDYERPRFPATWARRHEKGRVFYTSMGHREDVWTNPVFQSIFVGGIHWAIGQVDAAIPANINEVTPGANVLPQA
jgi:type 1 glutamine amidotransferase